MNIIPGDKEHNWNTIFRQWKTLTVCKTVEDRTARQAGNSVGRFVHTEEQRNRIVRFLLYLLGFLNRIQCCKKYVTPF